MEIKFGIASAYLKELRNWPSIRSTDAKGFRQIHRFLLKCQIMQGEGLLFVLDAAENIRMILSKFPIYTPC